MHNTRTITPDLIWIGGSDRRLSLFESNFPIPRGVSYNSYLLRDEQTVLLDSADTSVSALFFENLAYALDGRTLDYFVIHHMEPDHAALAAEVLRRYPQVKVVGNAKTFTLLSQFSGDAAFDRIAVKEGDTLSFGKHALTFLTAPMVHWPEVMVSYDPTDKILFSADAFGTFGALDGAVFADEVDFERDWLDDARRYYANICGKYGVQVQTLLKKAAGLDIAMICPLHGPVWRQDLDRFIGLYDKWSTYTPEDDEVCIFAGSMYGGTACAADLLASLLVQRGLRVKVYDVAGTHPSYLISEAFRAKGLVFAAPTYNNGLFLPMATLLHDLASVALRGRKVALIENGSWAPQAGKILREELGALKDMDILPETFTVKSAMHPDQLPQLEALADALAAAVRG